MVFGQKKIRTKSMIPVQRAPHVEQNDLTVSSVVMSTEEIDRYHGQSIVFDQNLLPGFLLGWGGGEGCICPP